MQCTTSEKHQLNKWALKLASDLQLYKTPKTNAPVDHNHVSFVLTYTRTNPTFDTLQQFLDKAPNSAYANRSHSCPPQLKEAARRIKYYADTIRRQFAEYEESKRMEFLSYVLSQCKRMMLYNKESRSTPPTRR